MNEIVSCRNTTILHKWHGGDVKLADLYSQEIAGMPYLFSHHDQISDVDSITDL